MVGLSLILFQVFFALKQLYLNKYLSFRKEKHFLKKVELTQILRTISKQDQRLLVISYSVALCFLCFIYLTGWTNFCVKSVRIRSFSGPYFPSLGVKTERYSVYIQSVCGKIRTRKTHNTDTFHAVNNTIAVIVWCIEFRKRRQVPPFCIYWPRKNSLSSFAQYDCCDC